MKKCFIVMIDNEGYKESTFHGCFKNLEGAVNKIDEVFGFHSPIWYSPEPYQGNAFRYPAGKNVFPVDGYETPNIIERDVDTNETIKVWKEATGCLWFGNISARDVEEEALTLFGTVKIGDVEIRKTN